MLKIDDLHKQFGKLKVLDGVSFELKSPGVFAVLGPNGSGKTTILKTILGMVIPDQGSLDFQGKPIVGKWPYRKGIGYLPQIAQFPQNLTVNEVIAMIKDVRNQPSDEQSLIRRFGLMPFLNKKLNNLSGGTKQKVNILLTFMFDSPLLILDEPTAGLDPVSLIKLKELILQEQAKGKTILVTTHIMSLVEEIADQIIFLLEGKIYFEGTVEQLLGQTAESDLEHAIAKILEEDV